MHKIIIILASLALILCSCQPEPITIDIPQAPPKMVISSQLVPNENTLLVAVSKNFSALKNGAPTYDSNGVNFDTTLLLTNSVVILQSNNTIDTLTEFSPGLYMSKPLDEFTLQNYTLFASHQSTGLTAWSSTSHMPNIVFDSIYPIISSYDKGNINVHYQFTDIPNQENWYLINYITGNKKDTTKSKIDVDYIASRMLNQSNNFDLITEKDFIAGKYITDKRLSRVKLGDTIAVAISNISKGYYDFLTVQKKASQLVNQIRAEVINFPTNIQGGYGFFTIHKPDIHLMELKN